LFEKDDLTNLLRRIFHGGLMRRVPKKREEADAIMALSLVGLPAEGVYDESEINVHLSSWLDGISRETNLDYVTLRRYLVDYGFLRRAFDGAVYRIVQDRIEEVLSPEARLIDVKAIFEEVATAREERRRAHRSSS
jgi:hypothetical protein